MMREHTRAAIQLLSGDIPERHVFTHTGWRNVGGVYVYLHAGGAIGAAGAVTGIQTALSGALTGYQLPEPPHGADLAQSIRASLATLTVAPDAVTVPLLAAVYRAVLGSADFSLFLAGGSGVGKSELAALMQQHFGAGLDREHLPANWSSTANALEGQAFLAKDALMVVDDFAPSGSAVDVARLHATADRLLRNQGNGSGRGRMNADGTLRPARPPRGLILSTGEDVPRGQSLRARMLILEVGRETVNFAALGEHQRAAAGGAYAAALSGFLQWLAVDFDARQARLKARIMELRGHAGASRQHKRTPALVADLAAGWELLLRYAQESGAITEAEYQNLWQRGWQALGAAADAQTAHQTASDPVSRFLELLSGALHGGIAHVAAIDGGCPAHPRAWGWRYDGFNEWRPLGARIGWLSGDDLYLLPDGSFDAAQRAAGNAGDGLTIGAKTLSKRLHERGRLRSWDESRDRLTVRRSIGGGRPNVLHLAASCLTHEESAQPTQAAHTAEHDTDTESDSDDDGPVCWADSGDTPQKLARQTGPPEGHVEPNPSDAGPVGPIGPASPPQVGPLQAGQALGSEREDLLAIAATRRYPAAKLDQAKSVKVGEEAWTKFVRFASERDLRLARAALTQVAA